MLTWIYLALVFSLLVPIVLLWRGNRKLWASNDALHQNELALREQLAESKATAKAQLASHQEKLELLQQARDSLSLEFKDLAQKIFTEKQQQFSKQQEANLGAMLNPLRERLKEFQQQVHASYDKESRERLSLVHELNQLKQLNQQMAVEASGLTQALRGQVKVQGCWGEVILERALEISGLQKGSEYETQVSLTDEANKQWQPDALIHLPDERQLIVDAKVTLTAYASYQDASDPDEQAQYLKQHLASLKAHLKMLSDKAYQKLLKQHSVDFVLMFLPIEGAFSLATQADPALYEDALSKNIILVTPSTLLATMRTVKNVWQVEKQNRHAVLIATKAGNLYDKFAALCQDLEELGRRLEQTRKSYDTTMNKLSLGKGSVVSRIEEMKTLGVKATKAIPKKLTESVGAEELDAS